MDAQPQAVPTMRSPERWLAVLRIAVGLWFLKALVTKLSVNFGRNRHASWKKKR